jgi:hypothetical protein
MALLTDDKVRIQFALDLAELGQGTSLLHLNAALSGRTRASRRGMVGERHAPVGAVLVKSEKVVAVLRVSAKPRAGTNRPTTEGIRPTNTLSAG